jgi:pimeloyl-ACP methyl ester carboxylesterase
MSNGTHYVLQGPDDGALVVMVSGIGDFSYRWERMATALVSAGRRVLRYDHYGKGWSQKPPSNHRYDSLVECAHPGQIAAGRGEGLLHSLLRRFDADSQDRQLHGLLEELGLASTMLTLIGHSMGGIVATVYARKHPAHVRDVVLIAPAGEMSAPPPFGKRSFRWAQAVVGWSPRFLIPLMAKATDGPPPAAMCEDYVGEHKQRYHCEWDAAWIAASRRRNGNYAFAAEVARMPLTTLGSYLSKLGEPSGEAPPRVLLMYGKDDTIVAGIDFAFWRTAAFPGATQVLIEAFSGGHGFHCEFPEPMAMVLDFLGLGKAGG